MARGHDRRFSAPDDSQYPAHNYGNTPFRGQYQFRSANRRHTGLAEPPSPPTAVPLLPQPVTRRGGARSGLIRSETDTGNIARTYWHEDLQERRTVPLADALSRGDGESAYPGKERKRDMLRKKWKKVIQAIKDLGDCNHRDEERQERVRRSISAPM